MVVAALSIPEFCLLLHSGSMLKLMPQQDTQTDNKNDDEQNTMMQSMKTMNMMMPIMSAIFCYTLPAGLGTLLGCRCCCKKYSAGCDQQTY